MVSTIQIYIRMALAGSLLLLAPTLTYAQWTPRIVDDNCCPSLVRHGDIDGDNDIDVISYRIGTAELLWHENLNGLGDFGPPLIVADFINGTDFEVGDIDNDGDLDLIGSAPEVLGDPGLMRFRNISGDGSFFLAQEIPTPTVDFGGGARIELGFIDNDNTLDIVVNTSSDTVVWYRNTNGDGFFDLGGMVIENFSSGQSLDIGDIDGDGDTDIIVGTSNIEIMSWFENLDGQGTFGPPNQVGSGGLAELSVKLGDIDGDNDLDAVALDLNSSLIAWWENLDGAGTFSDERLVANDLRFAVELADLDMDGDLDIISVSSSPAPTGGMSWYENLNGEGQFDQAKLIGELSFPNDLTIADIDQDGDPDPVTKSSDGIVWYENDLLAMDDHKVKEMIVHPNPASGEVIVDIDYPIESVNIYSMQGRLLLEALNTNTINIQSLSSGVYILAVATTDSRYTAKLVKK